jgi:hypothetical protein
MKATSDKLCKAAIKLAYREQPWEAYATGQKMMVFDGDKTGILQTDGKESYAGLPMTKERLELFKRGGMTMVTGGPNTANKKG